MSSALPFSGALLGAASTAQEGSQNRSDALLQTLRELLKQTAPHEAPKLFVALRLERRDLEQEKRGVFG